MAIEIPQTPSPLSVSKSSPASMNTPDLLPASLSDFSSDSDIFEQLSSESHTSARRESAPSPRDGSGRSKANTPETVLAPKTSRRRKESSKESPEHLGSRRFPISLETDDEDDLSQESKRLRRFSRSRRSTDQAPIEVLDVSESSPVREADQSRMCECCADTKPTTEFPVLRECTHAPNVCMSCYGDWINHEVNSKLWTELKCPGSECSVRLQHAEVRQFASREVFERFDDLSARSVYNDDPDFRWCTAPGCNSGQIHTTGRDGNIFRCFSCKNKLCVIHETPWHEGETCAEYDYRLSKEEEENKKRLERQQQDEASHETVKKISQPCPGKNGMPCGYNIQKSSGCDHMTCTRCKHEFCYICLAPYDRIRGMDNSAHRPDCIYHTTNLPQGHASIRL